MKHAIRTAIAFASLCLCSGAGAKIVTFQVPGGMYLSGMNDKGQVTGFYIDNRTLAYHGFLRQPDGTLTTFDVPVSLVTKDVREFPEVTIPCGISEDGVIAGQYGFHYLAGSFVRAANGTITPFSIGRDAIATAINPTGWTVGNYGLEGRHRSRIRSFLRDPTGASQEFWVPGARNTTYPSVVNRSRAIAGVARVANGFQAFFRPAHGKAALIGDPHSNVHVTGINDAGTVVGSFVDEMAHTVSFFWTSDGTLTTFTDPDGATYTQANAINNSGTIAGTFADSSNNEHGFVRAADGTFKTVDVDGAAYTDVRFINNKGAIAGTYYNNGTYGFVEKP